MKRANDQTSDRKTKQRIERAFITVSIVEIREMLFEIEQLIQARELLN